jgi:dolichol-phosphate mannosyltransferase
MIKAQQSYKNNNIENAPLKLSVVVPVFNEVENVRPLIKEIQTILNNNIRYEMIFIDDCSDDGTFEELISINRKIETLRVLSHKRRSGQSAAIHSGVRAARAKLVATLDGDGQNNPADIPDLLAAYENHIVAAIKVMICGQRTNRRDSFIKRFSSKIANKVRSNCLGDFTLDSGCGLKLFSAEDFMALPSFDHMHRFLPALMIRSGGKVVSVEVSHRSRERGKSKYGVFDRLWVGVVDLFGMVWLRNRPINPEVNESQ